MKQFAPVAIVLLLAACAPPVAPGEMAPMTQIYSQIPGNSELERKVELGNVTVDEITVSQVAPVTAQSYREALDNALLTSNFGTRAGDKPKYILDARLLELDVPMFGFSMESTAKGNYQLKRADSGVIVLSETITIPYTAEFSEAFDASQRARIATAKAMRENITHLIRVLASKSKSDLSGKGGKDAE